MARILVPDADLAVHVREALSTHAPDQADSVEVSIWDIDTDAPAPAAEFVVTKRPELSENFPRIGSIAGLQHVHLQSLGYEWVLDLIPQDVTLSNSQGAVEDATAEFALALTLAALRDIPGEVTKQQRRVWERPNFTGSIAGARVLVLGYGGVGTEVVRRLEPFRPQSISVMAGRARTENGHRIHGPEDLHPLLAGSDIVVITLPHTAETERLVDAEFLRHMPDGALLVNVGRGKLVNHEDLLAELNAGRLHAALDVVDPEPLPTESPLWDAKNLLIASHVAGNTMEFVRIANQLATDHVIAWVNGEPLSNAIARW